MDIKDKIDSELAIMEHMEREVIKARDILIKRQVI